tara:strand:- start:38 stop:418 length:381 start_codon:yes stop_codon:yes gene_type:complete
MFINYAYAQAAQSSGGQGFIIQLLPLMLIFVVFYFLLIRPQQKRVKQHQAMVSSLQKGKIVVTAGGIIAKVTKVDDEKTVTLEISPNVNVSIKRDTITEIIENNEKNNNLVSSKNNIKKGSSKKNN